MIVHAGTLAVVAVNKIVPAVGGGLGDLTYLAQLVVRNVEGVEAGVAGGIVDAREAEGVAVIG